MRDLVLKSGNPLLAMIQELDPSYHPIKAIHQIATEAHHKGELDTAMRGHTTILKYIAPELKAVEVRSQSPDNTVKVDLFAGCEAEEIDYDDID